ncbi:phospholipase D-like domain-containing protein [Actinokineospora iranica]|uniref:Uncharacterized protein n=1 Tax=Actinokineospora iranica TaxID=1271860 RepID=A0A1G6VCK9_9PSEU|nr:hypothetical protein [Actinokineospora iranica]SDD51318.1 hypothetical protein SAMN05216174_11263 [Actinokineospora iranica]
MAAGVVTFHSPLSLLRGWTARTGVPLREALVTGYTADLVFLERHFVALSRGLGARVTVLTDAGQAVHDPVDVRHAGLAYQHGHAQCAGVFHPKLVVLVGDDDVWAAIGSGNPTLAGWGHNDELWLVVRARRGAGPAALGDLGAWLGDLPDVVAMPSWIADTVRYIGEAVTPDEPDGSLPDLRIAGNLRHSLVSVLPNGPTDTLAISAPFFDAHAAAVREIVARLVPAELTIALQPTMAQYDGAALGAATATVPTIGLRLLAEDRMRHGKLVEWSVDGARSAMVGSANPSAAAMLATTMAGGNCELVVVCPVETTLVPDTETVSITRIQGIDTTPAFRGQPAGPSLVVVGARKLADRVVVELSTTATGPVSVQMSPDATPGSWKLVHVLERAGADVVSVVEFAIPDPLGRAVRAVTGDPAALTVSAVVFLTDTARCAARDDSTPRVSRDYPPNELFTDPLLASRFERDLEQLITDLAGHQLPDSTTTGTRTSNEGQDDRYGAWVRDTETLLGPSLASWVFPGLWRVSMSDGEAEWSIGSTREFEAEPVEEADAAAEELGGVEVDRTDIHPVPEAHHSRWRRLAGRLSRAVHGKPSPLALRAAVAKLFVNLLAGGVWEDREEWRDQLADVLAVLPPSEAEHQAYPGHALEVVVALCALGTALLTQDTILNGTSARDRVTTVAWEHTRAVIPFADAAVVADYLGTADAPNGRMVGTAEFQALVEFTTDAEDDPTAVLRRRFAEQGIPALRRDGVWMVDGEFRNPRRAAATAANVAGSPCAVLARNATKATAILRAGDRIAIAESVGRQWRVYQMGPASTPVTMFGGDEGLPPTRDRHPLHPVPRPVVDLAKRVGCDPAQLAIALAPRSATEAALGSRDTLGSRSYR